tara:strand:- start:192 stop:581 length:390 start_codon:yes stop_codon:yes gene_type:complete
MARGTRRNKPMHDAMYKKVLVKNQQKVAEKPSVVTEEDKKSAKGRNGLIAEKVAKKRIKKAKQEKDVVPNAREYEGLNAKQKKKVDSAKRRIVAMKVKIKKKRSENAKRVKKTKIPTSSSYGVKTQKGY